ncbi:MAG: tetratricopeptide repeat protein [Elusimicrobiota bacterium]|jgi:tetratricopeptide (TPR) repeat protein
MSKAWVKHEANTNEIAALLEHSALWVRMHQQIAVWTAAGVLAAAAIAATAVYRHFKSIEDSWAKYAVAQSYAYSGRPAEAFELLRRLKDEHNGTLAAGHAVILEGDLFYQQERFKEAAAAYRSLLDSSSDKNLAPLALSGLGLSQEAGQDCKSAVESDQRFLDSYQDHFLAPQVHASMARCLTDMGDAVKAKAAYERIAFLYPESSWAQWAKEHIKG